MKYISTETKQKYTIVEKQFKWWQRKINSQIYNENSTCTILRHFEILNLEKLNLEGRKVFFIVKKDRIFFFPTN